MQAGKSAIMLRKQIQVDVFIVGLWVICCSPSRVEFSIVLPYYFNINQFYETTSLINTTNLIVKKS
jgi:hypothetical protein